MSQQKLDQARIEFEALASRQSKPVAALTMVGIIHQAQGNTTAAKKKFEEVLAFDAHSAVAANNLAWMYIGEGGNLDVALKLAQTATSAVPDVPQLMDTLGWVYYKKDMAGLAVPLFERCVEKEPSNANYQYHLGLAFIKTGDTEKARAALQRALKSSPSPTTAAEIQRTLSAL
jgi:tetratricopeptide (TPR) repeat protein